MTGIERLREFAGGISSIAVCGVTTMSYDSEHREESWVLLRDLLADIADQIEHESDVETVRSDAMRAWEWVREHGGLDAVRRALQDAENQRAELCSALDIDAETGWSDAMAEMRQRVRRPAVLASDGEPLEAGQTVWDVDDGREYKVVTVESPVQFDTTSIKVDDGKAVDGVWIRPDNLTHTRPVLDADGVPIKRVDAVYLTDSPTAFVVDDIMTAENGSDVVHLKGGAWNRPQDLTHDRPDSWERVEADIADLPCSDYCDIYRIDTSYEHAMARDIVRRCRALAERGE